AARCFRAAVLSQAARLCPGTGGATFRRAAPGANARRTGEERVPVFGGRRDDRAEPPIPRHPRPRSANRGLISLNSALSRTGHFHCSASLLILAQLTLSK